MDLIYEPQAANSELVIDGTTLRHPGDRVTVDEQRGQQLLEWFPQELRDSTSPANSTLDPPASPGESAATTGEDPATVTQQTEPEGPAQQ